MLAVVDGRLGLRCCCTAWEQMPSYVLARGTGSGPARIRSPGSSRLFIAIAAVGVVSQ
ncbi:MAG: hypothetical protein ACLP01_18260 [Solirubrobacteraceae bacterium]